MCIRDRCVPDFRSTFCLSVCSLQILIVLFDWEVNLLYIYVNTEYSVDWGFSLDNKNFTIRIDNFKCGLYLVSDNEGNVAKLIVARWIKYF